jgi:hypothetical protein
MNEVTTMTELELLSARLQSLERRFSTIKLLGFLACLIGGALMLMGQAPPAGPPIPRTPLTIQSGGTLARPGVEEEVRTHQFILVDAKGRERASLVADNAGSVFLVMSDSAGKTRVNLSVSNDGPTLTLFDPSGRVRTILGSTTAVPSHVNDNGVAEMAPPSSIVFFDGKGKLLFRTP